MKDPHPAQFPAREVRCRRFRRPTALARSADFVRQVSLQGCTEGADGACRAGSRGAAHRRSPLGGTAGLAGPQSGGRAGALVPVAAGDVRRRHRLVFPAARGALDDRCGAAGRGGAGAPRTVGARRNGGADDGVRCWRRRWAWPRASCARRRCARPCCKSRSGPVDVYGFIELVEPRPTKGQRLTLRVTALEKHEPQEWPYRVRVRTMTRGGRARARRRRPPQGDALARRLGRRCPATTTLRARPGSRGWAPWATPPRRRSWWPARSSRRSACV